MFGEKAEHLPVEPGDQGPLGSGQPRGILDEGVEHRLQIERRAADRLQHLAGRRLLLQRFRQLVVAYLYLREEPHVLDRDHGLAGEGLQERDLHIAERDRLTPGDGDGADGLAVPEHRHRQDGPETRGDQVTELVFGIGADVRAMSNSPREDRPGGHTAAPGWQGERPPDGLEVLTCPSVVSREVDQRAVEEKDPGVLGGAQGGGRSGDGVEHGLDVGRRARDHTKDLTHGCLAVQ